MRGIQRKTLGPWPKYNEKAARKAATIAAGEVFKGVDPNDAKREARRQQAAEKQRTTLTTLIVEDGPYQASLTGRQVVNWKPAMSALRRGLKQHAESAVGDRSTSNDVVAKLVGQRLAPYPEQERSYPWARSLSPRLPEPSICPRGRRFTVRNDNLFGWSEDLPEALSFFTQSALSSRAEIAGALAETGFATLSEDGRGQS
ncbi:hypothetical protein ABIB80_006695 [Bradyrhizobium sp. i1.15.2]